MSYQALYRKFRPDNFEDVQGQDHIVTTLKNQIKSDHIGHAYLFCGTRGTGKTTVAKIFAKAVNCENPGEKGPCGECAMCRSIAEGSSMNVIEMDAASNNKVDDIRQVIEEVQYSPANGKYKVYNKRNAFENRDVHVCAPGKLYVSSVIKDRYFPKGRINEDEYYTYKCVYESDGIAVMSDGLYYYFQQPDSIMHKKKAYLNIDILGAFDERIEYFRSRQEERLAIISQKEKCIRETLLYARAKGCVDEKEKREYLKKMFKAEYLQIKGEHFGIKESIFLKTYYSLPFVVNILLERKIR